MSDDRTVTPSSPQGSADPTAAPISHFEQATAVQPVGPGVAAMSPFGDGPVGKVRDTGVCFLLFLVTFGIYGLVWYYKTHDEMKRHTGQGIGGGLALVLGIFVGIVMSFLSPSEVGNLYERRGQAKPVSGITGLWVLLLGWFFFVGLIVWFVKTNGALNAYWRSQGAR